MTMYDSTSTKMTACEGGGFRKEGEEGLVWGREGR